MFHFNKNQIFHLFPIFIALLITGTVVSIIVSNKSSIVQHDSAVATAKELYVSLSGSDSNPGTFTAPFRTFAKATSMLTPGTTLYIRGGHYNERLVVLTAGQPHARITITAYGSEKVVIDGSKVNTGLNGGLVFVQDGADYVTIQNLVIQNGQGRGVQMNGNYGWVVGNRIENFQHSGVNSREKVGVEIRNNEIIKSAQHRYPPDYSSWPASIGVWKSKNVKIVNNYIHDNFGEGVACYDSTENCYIAFNTISNNTSGAIYYDSAYNSVAERNFIIESNGASGMGTNDEVNPPRARNNTFRNNLVVRVDKKGFSFFNYIGGESGLRDMLIENNTFVNSAGKNVLVASGRHQGTVFRNNVFYSSNGVDLMEFHTPGDTRFINNLFFDTRGSSVTTIFWGGTRSSFANWVQSSNNMWGNPGFRNERGTVPDDFRTTGVYAALGFQGSVGADLSQDRVVAYPTVQPTSTATSALMVSPTVRPTRSPTPTPTLMVTPTVRPTSSPTPLSTSAATPGGTSKNIIINPSFMGQSGWEYYSNGNTLFEVKNNQAYIFFRTVGSNEQLYQSGITLRKNASYELSFTAYSTSGNDMSVYIHKHTSPYTNYGLKYYPDLSVGMARYTVRFNATNFAEQAVSDARLRFWFAGKAVSGDTYVIDDVSLVELGSSVQN